MITHVVFDFDGTLVDSRFLAIELYNTIARRDGYELLTKENLPGLRQASITERCAQLGVPLHRVPAMVLEVTRAYRGGVDALELQPGLRELFATLQAQGRRLMILSSNAEENIRAVLRRQAVEGAVDEVFTSSPIFGKARLLKRLMSRARLRPEQLVYVGDEHRDIVACREAGVRVIAVGWGFDAEERLREGGPDHLATTPAEIAECVTRWSA